MKHLFFYIVCFLALFNGRADAIEMPQFPDDFEGTETRQYWAEFAKDEDYELTFWQNINLFYEIGTYLYQKYSWEQIKADDFIEKIRPFFPGDSDEGLRKKQTYLINTASLYKMGKDMYIKIANKYLVPRTYRKVHDSSEYDHPGEVQYIPTADDEYVKVYNFKKFLSYSSNIDELNAISDFERNDEKNGDILTQIDRMIEKIDWKRVWFTGKLNENPLFSKLGIGGLQIDDMAAVRLLAEDKYTNHKKQLNFGLQVMVNAKYFVLANNMGEYQIKPQIDFSNSQNVAEAEVLYPMPQKAEIFPQAHKYFDNFLLPIKVTLQDPDKSVDLNATAKLTFCNVKLECQPRTYEVKMHTDVSGPDKLYNANETLFFNILNRIPNNKSKRLTLQQFNTVATPNGTELHLRMSTDKNVKTLEAYIEDNEGYTLFAEPNYILHQDGFEIYFKPLSADKNIDLSNTDYTVTVRLNRKYSYRDSLVPNTISTDIPENAPSPSDSVFLAIICGIILNFMPCCAPFVLLLLLLYIRASRKNPALLKPLQISAIKGSAVGILAVTLLFANLKSSQDYMIWGMQFSNMLLLCCLLFGLAALPKLLSQTAAKITQMMTSARCTYLFFVLGALTGALVYVGAAPYLSRLMNLSVVTSGLSALLIPAGLAIGFISVQYLMIYLTTEAKLWHILTNNQKIIIKCIRIALYLSLLWLLLFIGFQHGLVQMLILTAVIFVWMFLCAVCGRYLDYLDGGIWDESITLKYLQKIRGYCGIIMLLLLAIFIFIGHKITARTPTSAQTAIITDAQINDLLQQNKKVLIVMSSDWCFKCQISKHWTINPLIRERWQKHNNMEIIYQTDSDAIKQSMRQHNQFSLPFYIIYSPNYPKGIVLSSDAAEEEFDYIIE